MIEETFRFIAGCIFFGVVYMLGFHAGINHIAKGKDNPYEEK